MTPRAQRLLFAGTAACASVGVLISVLVAARPFNAFAFFTIDSNLLVGAACLLMAIRPQRTSTAFQTLRVTSVVAIAVTGIVYHAVLSQLLDLESWAVVSNQLVHTITPALAVIGWLVAGPRLIPPMRVLWLSLTFPAAWVAFTLIRGAIDGWYPYPFIDVGELGYARVALNCVWVAALMLGLAAALRAWERREARR